MNRRSFLSAIGLAPLAAWLSSRAGAKAEAPITVTKGTINPEGAAGWTVETIDADAALSGRYAYVAEPPPQLDFLSNPPQLREWLGPKCADPACPYAASRHYAGQCAEKLAQHLTVFAPDGSGRSVLVMCAHCDETRHADEPHDCPTPEREHVAKRRARAGRKS